jgi:hypothetical protein
MNSRLWNYKPFQQAQSVSLGVLADRLVFNIGHWWIYQPGDLAGRFPDINLVLPTTRPTRLSLAEEDAQFLLKILPQTKLYGDLVHPVTLICSATPQVRLEAETGIYNFQLSRSSIAGPEMSIVFNKGHLQSALKLGFRELELKDEDRPICAFSKQETYVWMPFSPTSRITDDAELVHVSTKQSPNPQQKNRPLALSR